jgi:signal transduction histidine kinase
MDGASEERLTFTIDSRLLEEIGENLVTRNHVAVGELVKNSYDADATEVVLKFDDVTAADTSDSEIAVIDDGTGMTLQEIRDDFMRIATTNKRRNPISERFGREKVGDKGIGRFACRRLADQLEIETTANLDDGGYQQTTLEIDWRDYESDQEIEEVDFPVTVQTIPEEEANSISTGTTLRLYNLKDTWSERDFNTLRRNMATLSVVQEANRGEKYDPDPGFEILFDAPEFDMGEGTLSEQIHDASWGCLEGEIRGDGTISLSLEAKRIGQQSYSFSHNNPGLAGTEFKISYLPLDTKEHYRDPQTLNITDAREISKDNSGVRVYKGGFRVFSYGGPDDDWLNIDEARATHAGRSPDETFEDLEGDLTLHTDFNRVLLSGPNNRNLVGRVLIDSDANLTMASNREDFQESDLFNDLRELVRLSIEWMTLQWSHYKAVKSQEELKEQTEEFIEATGGTQGEKAGCETESDNRFDLGATRGDDTEDNQSTSVSTPEDDSAPVNDALDLIEGVADTATDTVPEEDREVSDEAVDAATRVIKKTIDQKEQEIDFFRSAFSVNQVVFSFSHELRSMVGELSTNAGQIEAAMSDIPEIHRRDFKEIINDLREMEERFKSQMELFGLFMETGDQKEATDVPVSEVVERVKEATEYIADYYDVVITTDVPDLLHSPPMFESELYSIVINLVTNSIKAVGSASSGESRILIEGTKVEDGIKVRVYDTGVGMPQSEAEQAFQPLVSDPANNLYDDLSEEMPEELSDQLGRGTGLGLSIVRNIAEKYGGHAQFVETEEWTTCVEVVLNE